MKIAMLNAKLITFGIVPLLMVTNACTPKAQTFQERIEDLYSHEVDLLKPGELREKKQVSDTVYLLDTRQKKEYKVSHLRHSERVGYDDFGINKVSHIPKDATVVMYCTVGYRSEKIGAELQENGYENVYNLYGSMISWVNNGYPVYSSKGEETNKVHTYSEDWGEYLKKGKAVYD